MHSLRNVDDDRLADRQKRAAHARNDLTRRHRHYGVRATPEGKHRQPLQGQRSAQHCTPSDGVTGAAQTRDSDKLNYTRGKCQPLCCFCRCSGSVWGARQRAKKRGVYHKRSFGAGQEAPRPSELGVAAARGGARRRRRGGVRCRPTRRKDTGKRSSTTTYHDRGAYGLCDFQVSSIIHHT